VEPFNETRGFCGATPNWENVACAGPGDIRTAVGRSVGIFVMLELNTEINPPALDMSSCSGTLIGPDLVLCAGHCLTSPNELDALSGSFCFDFQTNCDGKRPAGYNPKFHKIQRVVKRAHTSTGGLDYSVIQLKTLPGVPPVPLRADLPSVNDPVFEIHHPQGIAKKVSARHAGLQATISKIDLSFGYRYIFTNTDLTGGSSGSALFDMSGQILGIADIAGHCQNGFLSITEVMNDISVTPPPPVPRDVMLVMDRSGSMSLDAGTGRTRIVEAHDAASLFVQLIRTGAGDRVGLVSFSTTAPSPPDFALTTVNGSTKNALIGSAPFSGGIVGGLVPGGLTSIGKGLTVAQSQFPLSGRGVNQRTVLLLTDGLENTPPMIADVDSSLNGDDLSVIGLGSESSLNGPLLNSLAEAHNGLYTRAGDGLKLRKFFALAYGNIFESGTLTDPEFFLPANQTNAQPLSFRVCSEDSITVVIGWDREDAPLLLALTTPGDNTVTESSAGTESSNGKTWAFLRVPLPFNGERDGTWKVQVFRPGGGEFPPPAVDVRYFVNVVVKGGPRLKRVKQDSRNYYTGDTINPLVMLKNTDGTVPDNAMAKVTVTRPANGVGNVLSQARLGPATTVNGDAIPARQATLLGIESATAKPVITYIDETHDLFDDGGHGDGGMEPDGIFGNPLTDLLKAEGHHTFHAVVTYGVNCVSTRETLWTVHVDTGIDPSKTGVQTSPAGTLPDGSKQTQVTITPKDK
jgi:Trypsin-like peptidase domain/von Willebrand factor type A domain